MRWVYCLFLFMSYLLYFYHERIDFFFVMFICWLMAYCAWAYYAGPPPVAHRCVKWVVCIVRLHDLNKINRNIKKDTCREVSWLSWLFMPWTFWKCDKNAACRCRASRVGTLYPGTVFALRTLPAIRSALVLGTKFKYEIRLENNPHRVFIYTFLFIGRGRGRLEFPFRTLLLG